MPIISTNDVNAHRFLKRKVVGTDFTLGKAVDKLILIDKELDLLNLTPDQLKELKRCLTCEKASTN